MFGDRFTVDQLLHLLQFLLNRTRFLEGEEVVSFWLDFMQFQSYARITMAIPLDWNNLGLLTF